MRTMSGGPCQHYDCSNRNSFGYCRTTACINEHYQQEQWGSPVIKHPQPVILEEGVKIRLTGLTRPDKDGKIREYVPCRRNDDGAEGFICPETGDFICIRPAEEGE